MALIKDRKLAADNWLLLEQTADGGLPAVPSGGDVIVPLALWQSQRQALASREGGLGVSLAGGENPGTIAGDFEHFDLVAVRFTSFTDGRGYSIARLLRERYGWRGELRAIGDIQRDQIFYLTRCGFDSLALREGEDVGAALSALGDFSEAYQTAVDRPLPLFRRRETVGAIG
jgi:uncharacterized protein (DUF934 family)